MDETKTEPWLALEEYVKSWIKRCVEPEIMYQYKIHDQIYYKGEVSCKVAMNVQKLKHSSKVSWHMIESIVAEHIVDGITVAYDNHCVFIFKFNM